MITSFDYKLEEAPRYPVAYCEECGEELYRGDDAFILSDDPRTLFCCKDCLDANIGIKEIEID